MELKEALRVLASLEKEQVEYVEAQAARDRVTQENIDRLRRERNLQSL